ncbi:hypothetical protein PR002_g14190 [Phytophthora rubi]|uniref:START domain-containing protein n=1 Tax=Phytophthora rubi TaxID=129364 RepID=A0A6A3L9P6_9STRA|nr:hypothetical protein PR002_g14190 [Phytophthora rubi]
MEHSERPASSALQFSQHASGVETGYLSSLGGDEWDPEVLLEAMVDNIGDFGLVESSEEPSRKKKKLNYDPNKARSERRVVLSQLRDEVEKLQTKLQQLQLIRGHYKKNGHPKDTQPPSHSGMTRVWKEVCVRQLNQRLRAERENLHLKQCCEREKQVVQSLKRLLYRQSPPSDKAYLEGTTRTRRIEIPTVGLQHMTALIFEQLSSGVEHSYREVEVVVEVNSPVSLDAMTPKPLLRDMMDGTRLEVFDHHILPFDMRTTADAWWQHWHNYRGRRVQDTVDNVVTESFGMEFSDTNADTTATFYVQQILRRHVEDHRTVFVWNAYVEPFTFENKRVSGIYFLEQSHVIIKPGGEGMSTRMSTCEIITRHFLDQSMKDDPKMAALASFVASSLSSNIMTRNEKIEDLLLDQTVQQRSC